MRVGWGEDFLSFGSSWLVRRACQWELAAIGTERLPEAS